MTREERKRFEEWVFLFRKVHLIEGVYLTISECINAFIDSHPGEAYPRLVDVEGIYGPITFRDED